MSGAISPLRSKATTRRRAGAVIYCRSVSTINRQGCAWARARSTGLAASIKRRIREACSPRHVPNEVRQIAEVPRTLSGKVLEVPVKRILMGTPPEQAASVESLANPRSLDYFVALARERALTASE
jgi:hypothetical protein